MTEELNPFAPPTAPVEHVQEDMGEVQLATRWERLFGAIIDGLIASVVLVPAMLALVLGDLPRLQEDDPFTIFRGELGLVSLFLWLAVLGVQAYLVAKRGQSIGKIALKTRIEKMDGSLPGFVHGVVVRNWVFVILGFMPGVSSCSSIVNLADALLIFRRDRRCLHDHLAGTQVVQARTMVG